MTKIKIILVDDHRIFRDGIKSLLSDEDYVEIIGDVSGGDELLELLEKVTPDIIIIDITLQGLSGIDISKELASLYPDIKIMVLSMHTKEEFVINAINAGIKGYLSKDTSREELLEAIKTIYDGGEYFSKLISDIFLKSYINKFKTEQHFIENKELTKRELELLKLFATGLSNKEVADKLCISSKTVDCHKSNIMKKLKLKNSAELVLYAVKNKIIDL
jgi:DNA-binding NarL/FixJ family response regulator